MNALFHFPYLGSLLMTSVSLLAFVGAFFTSESSAAVPPDWPDEVFVARGCFLSATAYIAKVQAWNPHAAAHTATVVLPNGLKHTIAVVHSDGRAYGRDQYIGVFRIQGREVQASFLRALQLWLCSGGRHGYPEKNPRTLAERRAELDLAARLIRADSRRVQIETEEGLVSALTWRTPEGGLAVYEPTFGTAVTSADFAPEEVARLVLAQGRQFATR
jgi:hypothetical protein